MDLIIFKALCLSGTFYIIC